MIIADYNSPDLACLSLLKHLQLPSELCLLTSPYGLVCLRAFALSRSTGLSATVRTLARSELTSSVWQRLARSPFYA